jgi:hypothetical protein
MYWCFNKTQLSAALDAWAVEQACQGKTSDQIQLARAAVVDFLGSKTARENKVTHGIDVSEASHVR